MRYMNQPGVGGRAINPGTVNGIPGYNEDEYANQLIAVFREFGERYGPRVAGYWFDSTFEATECYPNLPFDKINDENGRAHVRTPVTNAQLVCRLMLDKKNNQHEEANLKHQRREIL